MSRREAARLWLGLSYLEWARVTPGMEEGLDLAIRLGIQALEAATRAKDEEYIAIAKSNLAYYYAQQQAQDKKEIALQYAMEARANIVQFPKRLTWLTNDIYVRMMFSDCDGMAPIKRDAEDLMNRFSDIREELRGYIEEMKRKCPALDDGASR